MSRPYPAVLPPQPDTFTLADWLEGCLAEPVPTLVDPPKFSAPSPMRQSSWWRELANCRTLDPSTFFPNEGIRLSDLTDSTRRRIIWRVLAEGWTHAAAAAEAGCAERTVGKWVQRVIARGDLKVRQGSRRNVDARAEAAAKAVCAGCEVRAECLQYALDNNERFGVWGGASESERAAMRRISNPVEAA